MPKRSRATNDGSLYFVRRIGARGNKVLQQVRERPYESTLTELVAQRDAQREVLDWLPVGVVLADAACNIVMMNRVAEEILSDGDGLVARPVGPHTLSLQEPKKLCLLIRETVQTASGDDHHAGTAMSLSRPSMRRPLSVLVVSLKTSDRVKTARIKERHPVAAIFVNDPERPHQMVLEQLTHFYGLTAAEAKLAQGIAAGKSLHNLAKDLGITTGTARSHLSRIYLKTGTHRQVELVQMVLTGPAIFCRNAAPLNELM